MSRPTEKEESIMYKVNFGHRIMEQREGEWYNVYNGETYDETELCETSEEVMRMFEAYLELEYDGLLKKCENFKGYRKFGRDMNFESKLTANKQGKKHHVYFKVSRA